MPKLTKERAFDYIDFVEKATNTDFSKLFKKEEENNGRLKRNVASSSRRTRRNNKRNP